MTRTLLRFVGLWLAPLQGHAAEFYVDPVNGSPAGDGSADRPWRPIQEVFDAGWVESRQWAQRPYTRQSELVTKNVGAPVHAGDTIWLRSGYHGDLLIDGYYNQDDITLAAEVGHDPRLSSLRISLCHQFEYFLVTRAAAPLFGLDPGGSPPAGNPNPQRDNRHEHMRRMSYHPAFHGHLLGAAPTVPVTMFEFEPAVHCMDDGRITCSQILTKIFCLAIHQRMTQYTSSTHEPLYSGW